HVPDHPPYYIHFPYTTLFRSLDDLRLDIADRLLGARLASVHDLPSWTFRQIAADVDDEQAQHRTEQEAQPPADALRDGVEKQQRDRKSTRLNSSHGSISYAVF